MIPHECSPKMVVRIVAAAEGYHSLCFLNVFLLLCLLVSCRSSRGHPYYSRHELLIVGFQYEQAVTSDFVHLPQIPEAETGLPVWNIHKVKESTAQTTTSQHVTHKC